MFIGNGHLIGDLNSKFAKSKVFKVHWHWTFYCWLLDLVKSNIPFLHSLISEGWPKLNEMVDFWLSIPHRSLNRSFCSRVDGNSKLGKFLMKWVCSGHWGYRTEVVEAFQVIEAAEFSDIREITQCVNSSSFWFFKAKEAVEVIKATEVFITTLTLREWWNFKWNSAIIQNQGCGGQGFYF